jgi:hypothetical protein
MAKDGRRQPTPIAANSASTSRSSGECWFKFNWKLEFGNEISEQSTHFIDGFGAI